jgi:hypothetical protein
MRGEPVPRPRRIGQHISRVLDLLDEIGAREVTVWKTRHVVVQFAFRGRTFEVHCACTPKNEHDGFHHARQSIQRTLRAAGLGG